MGTSFHIGYFTTEGDQCNGGSRRRGGIWVKARAFVGKSHSHGEQGAGWLARHEHVRRVCGSPSTCFNDDAYLAS
jgi:hypothetical protein